ncbi:TetR/AcrR family transcriptional regulator [Streptomyces diastatochromogenes]|uniref:TetR/AcrR family transcriptional regulator n=1 Tax=Streptomyces diastatochromogenes TaxID=42236 RepID=UPI0036CDFFCE
MDFQRARNDEQRSQRRQHILKVTAEMLTEMPVAKLSLNELSRRVGLAKANVQRYFESREAILLQLLDAELKEWLDELEVQLEPVEGTVRERGDRLAKVLAETLAQRPVLCDLISAQAAVLERNVSPEVSRRHKYATLSTFQSLAQLARRCLPELGAEDALRLTGFIALVATAAWPYIEPSQAVVAQYPDDPVVTAMHVDFADVVRQSLEVSITGLLTRHEDAPLGMAPLAAMPAHRTPHG